MLIVLASFLLVVIALRVTWHDENMRWIAFMLAVSMGMSNAVHFFGTVEDVPGVYTMAEMFVATAAYVAWEHHRQRWQVVLGVLSAISITANIARVAILHPDRMQINMHEAITNIIFAMECLATIGMGVAHGVGTGRFHWRLGLRHEAPESHGLGDRGQ